METPKFLRKYKLVFKVIKYVIGFVAMMYLISMCTYLISSESTFCCIMGMSQTKQNLFVVLFIMKNHRRFLSVRASRCFTASAVVWAATYLLF